jgi:hypothetical protein
MASNRRVSRRGYRRPNPRPPAKMNAAEIALVLNTLIGLFLCYKIWKRGNAGVIKTVRVKNAHRWTDVEKEMVEVVDKDGNTIWLAFTDGGFTGAKTHGNRLKGLVKSGQAEVL